MKSIKTTVVTVLSLISISCFAQQNVLTGADLLIGENFHLIENKSIGIVTNHTAILQSGTHLVDTLVSMSNVNVKVLFGPEHGIRGDAPDGNTVQDSIDALTGIPVLSLYGEIRKPTSEMLQGVDLLVFDIQDIGARFYTFISTMYYTIEAAAENNIPIIILDRPNPIGGLKVDGPLRPDSMKSFVAIAPIPIMHGMTVGELAALFNEERMIKSPSKADLIIIKMKNWKRSYYFDDCGLQWINPSPNMVSVQAAIVYPGTCLIEGINVSEGRGTLLPFLQFGAPYINSTELSNELKTYGITGVTFEPVEFIPRSIPNMSSNPKYKDEICYGLKLSVTDRENFEPVKFGIQLLTALRKLYPAKLEFRRNTLDRLFGQTYLKEMLREGESLDKITLKWKDELEKFKSIRKEYLLYD